MLGPAARPDRIERCDLVNTEYRDNASLEEGPTIALGTELSLQLEGTPERISAVVAGVVAGECLIIRGAFDSLEGQVVEGSRATVRYTQHGAMNTFASQWMGAIQTPVDVAFITYPEAIEASELRACQRKECFLPAELIIRNEAYLGTVQDISEKGCKFIRDVSGGRDAPAVDEFERVILVVQMPEGEDRREISGEVRNVCLHAEFDTEEMHVGVKFQDETAESLKGIVDYASAVELL